LIRSVSPPSPSPHNVGGRPNLTPSPDITVEHQ
jgi:hypothetical protein